jgi:ribulose-phosphate 3-epimerase
MKRGQLMQDTPRKISPSLMCADFLNLKHDLDIFRKHEIELIHVDIMDGHYVRNFTLGEGICEKVAAYTDIPLDIHLMVDNPNSFVGDFARFSGSIITFHPEVVENPLATIDSIKKHGAKAGIALKPDQPLERFDNLLPHVDVLCVMTVVPGFAGQRLFPGGIERLRSAAEHVQIHDYRLEIMVDGNVSWDNLPRMRDAGAQIFVAGTSSIFEKGGDLDQNIRRFRTILGEG